MKGNNKRINDDIRTRKYNALAEQKRNSLLKEKILIQKEREKLYFNSKLNDIQANQIYHFSGSSIEHKIERVGKLKLLETNDRKYVFLSFMSETYNFEPDANERYGFRIIPAQTKRQKVLSIETFIKFLYTGHVKRAS